jgi:hypothetical protein
MDRPGRDAVTPREDQELVPDRWSFDDPSYIAPGYQSLAIHVQGRSLSLSSVKLLPSKQKGKLVTSSRRRATAST